MRDASRRLTLLEARMRPRKLRWDFTGASDDELEFIDATARRAANGEISEAEEIRLVETLARFSHR